MIERPNDLYVPDREEPFAAIRRSTHLAIGAHQDDLEIFAYHGIAECFDQSDAWFGGITVTDGGGSARSGAYSGYSDEQMKQVRHEEQNRAADIGCYAFQAQLGYPSSTVKDPTLREQVAARIAGILDTARPETLYLHNPFDKHPTHLAVLRASLDALRSIPQNALPAKVYGCEVWRDLDWLPDDLKVALPSDRHPGLARQLIEVFDSQVAGGKNYVVAALGRRAANATFFSSHLVDDATALTFAVDLTPLIGAAAISLERFVEQSIHQFGFEVSASLAKLGM